MADDEEDSMSRITFATAALLSALSFVLLTGQETSTFLPRVQALGLESLPGIVVAYTALPRESERTSLKNRLSEALTYYDDRLGVRPTFALADPERSPLETGCGFTVSSIPWHSSLLLLCLLALDLTRSVIVMGWQAEPGRAAPVSENVLEAAGVSIQEAPYRLNDLIGYHEVGHVVIWEYGLRQTQSWFDEMLATFAAYAFLSDRYTGEARVWDALMQRHIESIKPAFRDLESFNARYPDDIPQETYAWYQAMFHQRVADVHKAPNRLIAAARVSQGHRRGFEDPLGIVERLRDAELLQWDDVFGVMRFLFWAHRGHTCATCGSQDQDCQVVVLNRIRSKVLDLLEHAFQKISRGQFTIRFHTANEAIFAKFLTIGVQRFRNAVAENHQRVAGIKL